MQEKYFAVVLNILSQTVGKMYGDIYFKKSHKHSVMIGFGKLIVYLIMKQFGEDTKELLENRIKFKSYTYISKSIKSWLEIGAGLLKRKRELEEKEVSQRRERYSSVRGGSKARSRRKTQNTTKEKIQRIINTHNDYGKTTYVKL